MLQLVNWEFCRTISLASAPFLPVIQVIHGLRIDRQVTTEIWSSSVARPMEMLTRLAVLVRDPVPCDLSARSRMVPIQSCSTARTLLALGQGDNFPFKIYVQILASVWHREQWTPLSKYTRHTPKISWQMQHPTIPIRSLCPLSDLAPWTKV